VAAVLGGRSEVWLCASIVSTLFAFSWDVLVDWGLGPQPMRRAVRQCLTPGAPQGGEFADASWWLRPVRVFPTSWYIVGIIADLVLRLSWAVYISPGQQVVAQNMTLLLGTVELMRRAVWALFRVEWEQILRVAKQEHERKRKRRPSSSPLQYTGGDVDDEFTEFTSRRSLRRPLLDDGTTSKEQRIKGHLERNLKRMESGRWEEEEEQEKEEEDRGASGGRGQGSK